MADLLAEREPERQVRRLGAWLRAAAREEPLVRDPACGAALGGRVQALGEALARTLAADDPAAALTAVRGARRALLEVRALLAVARDEGVLHEVQFDLLTGQAARVAAELDGVELRAGALGWAAGRPESGQTQPPARR
jgi:hypothetical protein